MSWETKCLNQWQVFVQYTMALFKLQMLSTQSCLFCIISPTFPCYSSSAPGSYTAKVDFYQKLIPPYNPKNLEMLPDATLARVPTPLLIADYESFLSTVYRPVQPGSVEGFCKIRASWKVKQGTPKVIKNSGNYLRRNKLIYWIWYWNAR